MNTIMITGTAKTMPVNTSPICVSFKVEYDVNIWASKQGEQLQFISSKKLTLCGYNDLWRLAKSNVISLLGDDAKFDDGAYTQFLDHLIMI